MVLKLKPWVCISGMRRSGLALAPVYHISGGARGAPAMVHRVPDAVLACLKLRLFACPHYHHWLGVVQALGQHEGC
eukprot:9536494-Alexandrium_andersonii.AAC.1